MHFARLIAKSNSENGAVRFEPNPTALTPTSKITQANPIGSPLSKVLGVLEELVGAVGLKVPESTRTKFPLRFA